MGGVARGHNNIGRGKVTWTRARRRRQGKATWTGALRGQGREGAQRPGQGGGDSGEGTAEPLRPRAAAAALGRRG